MLISYIDKNLKEILFKLYYLVLIGQTIKKLLFNFLVKNVE